MAGVTVPYQCAHTGIVLAQSDGPDQIAVLGKQAGGRVAFFLRVDDFDEAYERNVSARVPIVREPSARPQGRVAVFLNCMGNPWDLVGPP
jgi:predicted enzyme related to lactoylglutathione lyase